MEDLYPDEEPADDIEWQRGDNPEEGEPTTEPDRDQLNSKVDENQPTDRWIERNDEKM
jgi:hypothetical protein